MWRDPGRFGPSETLVQPARATAAATRAATAQGPRRTRVARATLGAREARDAPGRRAGRTERGAGDPGMRAGLQGAGVTDALPN
ncbi:hypothetical protein GCM10010246_72280 [Streptomyces cuspidosporus]|uniref:Uncharacterized protein n=1 Tax=Streptomyces cuspidosporus TaxID=66882 RepID=A0ABN3H3G3_9ACTN